MNDGLICELQHVVLVGLSILWFVVWLGVDAYTHASTDPRWEDSTVWKEVVALIAWFIAAVNPAPCAKNIVSLKAVDLTWLLVRN